MFFNFLKSKPRLKEIIPNGFVDIHSHILPGIDDGAKNTEESKLLIEEMMNLGFSKIIGTPHTYPGLYENTTNSIKSAFEKINNLTNTDINIGYASEYMIDRSIIKKAEEKKLLCIKDNYVLIEMSFMNKPNHLYETIFHIKINDYIPILAHPERYLFFFNDFKSFYKLKKAGCLFQLNLLSTTGYYGENIIKLSDKLLKNKLIDFVGSDIHNVKHIENFNKRIKISEIDNLKKAMSNTSDIFGED